MTIVVTNTTGASAKPVGLLYVEPDMQLTDAGAGTALADSGLDAAFVADLLSACLAHERCGVRLYRSVAGRSVVPELREQYEHFLQETEGHVSRLEDLIAGAGGDPHYVSPAARAAEKAGSGLCESTFMLAGSVDYDTAELAMLEAVMLAEAKDHANWELLSELAGAMTQGDLRTQFEQAAAEVLDQEEEHYSWAKETLASMLYARATGGAQGSGDAPGSGAIDLESASRDELYAAAQEAGIAGRSQMTKEELAAAVSEHMGGKA